FNQHILIFLLLPLLFSCRSESERTSTVSAEGRIIPVEYASGFQIEDFEDYQILTVENPWPGSEKAFRYLLYEEGASIPEGIAADARIKVPVKKIVVTSTTHIPSLEALGMENSLVGFPGLQYISSENTRKRISE